jgi:hypothetical protein
LPTQSQIKKKEKKLFSATISEANTVSLNKRLRKSFSELVKSYLTDFENKDEANQKAYKGGGNNIKKNVFGLLTLQLFNYYGGKNEKENFNESDCFIIGIWCYRFR